MSFATAEIEEMLTSNFHQIRVAMYGADRTLSTEQTINVRRKAEKITRRLVNDDQAWAEFCTFERRRDGLGRPERKRAGMSHDLDAREVPRSALRAARRAVSESWSPSSAEPTSQ